jgi:ABC-2 type transport system permease protein
MTTLVSHVGYLTSRSVRALLRQPIYVAVTLVQPMIWLLLFGQLFSKVVSLPGFGGSSYIAFLTPGVVVMTALFSSGWSGMGFITDMDRGVMDRLLVTPVRRGAVITGSLANQALATVIQSLIIVLVGVAAGARYSGGALGIVVSVCSAVLLATAFASFSNAVALLTRRQETLIGLSTFLVLPLTFLSSAVMATQAAPAWIRHAASYNPVNWAVVASRSALSADPAWGSVLAHLGGLLAVAVVLGWLATRAFRAYQRSV